MLASFVASTTAGTGLYIKNDGNIGIGTTTPDAALVIGDKNLDVRVPTNLQVTVNYITRPAAPTGVSVTPTIDNVDGTYDDGEQYRVHFYSYKNYGEFKVYSVAATSTLVTIPTDANTYGLQLSWSAVSGIDGYAILIEDPLNDAGRYFNLVGLNTSFTANSISIDTLGSIYSSPFPGSIPDGVTLANGTTTHAFSVVSFDTVGNTRKYSTTATSSNVTVDNSGRPYYLTFSWNGSADGYRVYRKDTNLAMNFNSFSETTSTSLNVYETKLPEFTLFSSVAEHPFSKWRYGAINTSNATKDFGLKTNNPISVGNIFYNNHSTDLDSIITRISGRKSTNYKLASSLDIPYQSGSTTVFQLTAPTTSPNNLIGTHGMVYAEGYMFGSTRFDQGYIWRLDPKTGENVTVKVGFGPVEAITYSKAKRKIYAVEASNTPNPVQTIHEIDPITMEASAVIDGYTDFGASPAITNDDSYIYLLTFGVDGNSVLYKWSLDTYAEVASTTLVGRNNGHAIEYDNGYLYMTGSTDTWVASISTSLSSATLASSTLTGYSIATDDMAVIGDYIWISLENTDKMLRISKNNLASRQEVKNERGYAMFYDGDYLYQGTSSTTPNGKINITDPRTLFGWEMPTGKGSPNEIYSDGTRIFYTDWSNSSTLTMKSLLDTSSTPRIFWKDYSNGERLSLETNGNVKIDYQLGIGTTTPNARIGIVATSSISNIINVASSTGATMFRLTNTGVLSLSTLVSCGGLQTNASGVFSCTSDENFKDVKEDFSAGLDEVLKINPKTFSWKEGTDMFDGGVLYNGFIAQNIRDAIPGAVTEGSSGQLQINHLAITAATVNAIKGLNLKVEKNATSTNENILKLSDNFASTTTEIEGLFNQSSSTLNLVSTLQDQTKIFENELLSLNEFASTTLVSIDRLTGKIQSVEDRFASLEIRFGSSTLDLLNGLNSDIKSLLDVNAATSTLKTLEDGTQITEETFVGKFFDRIISWFADVKNGIVKLFAKEIYTEKLCVKKSNGENVCVTGDELERLIPTLTPVLNTAPVILIPENTVDEVSSTSTSAAIVNTESATNEGIIEPAPQAPEIVDPVVENTQNEAN